MSCAEDAGPSRHSEAALLYSGEPERLVTTLSPTDRLRGLRVLIGNTPLLAIEYSVDAGEPRRLYAKAESLNLTGSIKDRMALHMLRRARESGELKPGGLIVEATSGNTGISFCAVGRALGHPVTDLHARLDERGADRADQVVRRHDPSGVQGGRRLPRVDRPGGGARGRDPRGVPPPPVRQRREFRGPFQDHGARNLVPAGQRGAGA